jgi:hypothetical protein
MRELKNELMVRNVAMFRTNFTGTWTWEFLCFHVHVIFLQI